MFSLLAPDALQKYYTEFLPLKCHQHKHGDILKYTLRLANFHAASEFQFSNFPSILSLTHPVTESRKGKSMFVEIETQKNNPIGGLFIMLKTPRDVDILYSSYTSECKFFLSTQTYIRVEKTKPLSNDLLIDSKKYGTEQN